MDDKRNLFLAIGLSLLVLVGWQFLVAPRFMTKRPEPVVTQEGKPVPGKKATTPLPSTPGTPAATPATPARRWRARRPSRRRRACRSATPSRRLDRPQGRPHR